MPGIVNRTIEVLLESSTTLTTPRVAQAAGVSRQAAHKALRRWVRAGVLVAEGRARACRYRVAASAPAPQVLRRRLEVASAGSLYRLSARILLDGVEAGDVALDFTGVAELGDEFLDEVFLQWAPRHPRVHLRVEHLPGKFAPQLFALARAQRSASSAKVG